MTEAPGSAEQALAQLRRGRALIDLGRPKDALAPLAESLRLDPHSAETCCHLAWALQLTGDLEQSLTVCDEAIRLEPNNEWPHRLQSIVYREQGHHDVAIAKAREAQRLAPELWQTGLTLSDALLSKGKVAEAQQVAEDLRRIAPDNSSTFSLLGRIALVRKQLLEAERYFREALRLNPRSVAAHNNLGTALMEQGRVKEAVPHFDSALAIDPTTKEAQSNLYLGARKLRRQAWLATSRGLLLRISPKMYQHYLHREQSSFGVFLFVFLWKIAAPISAAFVMLAYGIRRLTGDVDGFAIWSGGVCLTLFMLVMTYTFGWARRYLEPSARQVQIITTLSAWIFSPLTLAGLGVLGLILDPSTWALYLLLTITGLTFFGRQMARRMRGVYYAVASRLYPSALRWRARYEHFVTHTVSGRRLHRVSRLLRNPVFYIVLGTVGSAISNGEELAPLWFAVMYGGLLFGLFRLFRLFRYARERRTGR